MLNYKYVAVFEDGMAQTYDDNGKRDFKNEDIVKLKLIPNKPGLVPFQIDINREKGEILFQVWRRLNKIVLREGEMPHGFQSGPNTIDVIGIKGPEGNTYLFVRPDGSVRMSTNIDGE